MGKKDPVWQDEALVRLAFQTANSAKELLTILNLNLGSANYSAVTWAAQKYGIEVPKWQPRNVEALVTLAKSKMLPLSEVMIENSTYSRNSLKRRLICEGVLEYRCYFEDCPTKGMTTWRGQKIVFQLDHINGIYNDNRIENLRFLCPICHSQTETFAGKNCKK